MFINDPGKIAMERAQGSDQLYRAGVFAEICGPLNPLFGLIRFFTPMPFFDQSNFAQSLQFCLDLLTNQSMPGLVFGRQRLIQAVATFPW